MVLLYLTLGATVWWTNHLKTNRLIFGGGETSGGRQSTVFLSIGAILLLAGFTLHTLPDGKLHIAFLDIGQGDAILITTPRGHQILIDGGPSPAQLGQRLGEEMPFWDHSLNMVINTHPDADHLAGLVNILERYHVDTVLVSDATSKSALYREWETQLKRNNQQTITAWEGMHLNLDEEVEAIVLNPGPYSSKAEAPNDHSVTVKIVMGEISFLLSGDMESEVEEALAHSGLDLTATVFKSPHHGSNTSSHPDFLAAVNPQIVVISVGQDNRFGHPREEILQRYSDYGLTVFRTDQLGTVELITDGAQIWMETQR
jgi:competence protein ComEC